MGLAFYIYTILVLLISAGSGMISLSAYFVSRKRAFLYATAFFLFYCLDVALIFQFEYVGQNIDFSPEHFYAIDNPFLKIAIAVGTLESILLIVCDYVDERHIAPKVLPPLAFCIACAAIVLLLPEDNMRQWLFYTMRQVFLLWCIVYALIKYAQSKNELYRIRLKRHRNLVLATFFLIIAITIEDTFMILIWEPNFDTSLLPLYLTQRNFCENILMLIFAFFTMKASAKMLRLRFHEPPDPNDNPSIMIHIDEQLPSYCTRHGLTNRERDILALILANKDTQNIASELHLATGTVKVHVHNILHKTGNETRRHLVKDFWRE